MNTLNYEQLFNILQHDLGSIFNAIRSCAEHEVSIPHERILSMVSHGQHMLRRIRYFSDAPVSLELRLHTARSIAALVERLASEFNLLGYRKVHLREINTNGDHTDEYMIDFYSIEIVLRELIDNAIKNSRDREDIDISLNFKQNRPAVVRISNKVRDEAEVSFESWLQRYRRGAGAMYAGMGMGLYIAKKIASQQNVLLYGYSLGGAVEISLIFQAHHPERSAL
jgi:signal transduction histidine kinase